MRRDLRRIVSNFTPAQCEALRTTPESDLIRFHRTLGMGFRNGFRHRRYLGLSAYCHAAVGRSGTPLSFDALSSVAVREVWRFLQSSP